MVEDVPTVVCAWCHDPVPSPAKTCSEATEPERKAIATAIAAGAIISDACKRELAARGYS